MNQVEPDPNRPTTAPALTDDATGGTVSAGATVVRPRHPPGQRSRKARRYSDQIRKLHAEGYTLDDIREALADAGVMVSKSTVQREASRQPPSPTGLDRRKPQPPPIPQVGDDVTTEPHWTAAASATQVKQSGKDVAAAYFAANNFNPLFRKDER